MSVNRPVIERLRERNKNTRERFLEVRPRVNNEAENQASAPLVTGDAFQISTRKFLLPENMVEKYGPNMETLIATICREVGITQSSSGSASFNVVVPALASENNQAEFVPAFVSPNGKLNAVVASFPLDGNGALLLDNVRVEYKTLSCPGRQTAPDAIKRLDAKEIVVVQLSYEFLLRRYQLEVNERFKSAGIERDEPILSAYPVTCLDSYTQNQITSEVEDGARTLREVSVYVVRPKLVKVQDDVENILREMQEEADGLWERYETLKVFRYEDISQSFDRLLRNMQVTTTSDIVENSLLKMAGITQEPIQCSYSLDGSDIVVRFGLPKDVVKQFVENLNAKFPDVCSLAPNLDRHDLRFRGDRPNAKNERNAVKIKFSAFAEDVAFMRAIQQAALEILSDPHTREAYQEYSKRKESRQRQQSVYKLLQPCLATYEIDIKKAPMAAVVLAKMFDHSAVEEQQILLSQWYGTSMRAKFKKGRTYVAAMLDMMLYMNLTPEMAALLVTNINHQFPHDYPLARLVSTNAKIAETDNETVCAIAIDTSLFHRREFIDAFVAKTEELHEKEPMLFDKWRDMSGRQPTLSSVARNLTALAGIFKKSGFDGVSDSISQFKTTLTNPQATLQDRKDDRKRVQNQCTLWKQQHTQVEADDFAENDEAGLMETLYEIKL